MMWQQYVTLVVQLEHQRVLYFPMETRFQILLVEVLNKLVSLSSIHQIYISYLPLAHIYERSNQIILAYYGRHGNLIRPGGESGLPAPIGAGGGDLIPRIRWGWGWGWGQGPELGDGDGDDTHRPFPAPFPCLYYGGSVRFYQGVRNLIKVIDTEFGVCGYYRVMNAVKSSGGLREKLFNAAFNAKRQALLKGNNQENLSSQKDPLFSFLYIICLILSKSGKNASPCGFDIYIILQKQCFGCPVVEGYGMTESSCVITCMNVNDVLSGHVGAPNAACGQFFPFFNIVYNYNRTNNTIKYITISEVKLGCGKFNEKKFPKERKRGLSVQLAKLAKVTGFKIPPSFLPPAQATLAPQQVPVELLFAGGHHLRPMLVWYGRINITSIAAPSLAFLTLSCDQEDGRPPPSLCPGASATSDLFPATSGDFLVSFLTAGSNLSHLRTVTLPGSFLSRALNVDSLHDCHHRRFSSPFR
ncbi:hypothetical protein LXL04_004134 [Taraxacum kok-saghyz]